MIFFMARSSSWRKRAGSAFNSRLFSQARWNNSGCHTLVVMIFGQKRQEREDHMFSAIKVKKAVLAALAGAAICIACPTAGHADWDDHHHWRDHDTNVVVAIPGLSIGLGDDVF